MSMMTNNSEPVALDALLGLTPPTIVVAGCSTTNASTAVTVPLADNIPAAGYVSGPGVPAGAKYTIAGTNVTLSAAATATSAGAATLTFSSLPCTLYFALFTSAPAANGGGTEVTAAGYARVPVTNNPANFPATAAYIKSNGNAIQWPVSAAAWGTIVAWGAFDAVTGGNLWFYGTVTSVTMNSGDSIQFAVGQFAITF